MTMILLQMTEGYLDLSLGSSTTNSSMFKHGYYVVIDDGGYLDLSLGSSTMIAAVCLNMVIMLL